MKCLDHMKQVLVGASAEEGGGIEEQNSEVGSWNTFRRSREKSVRESKLLDPNKYACLVLGISAWG